MKDKKTNTPFAEDGQRAHVDHKTGRCQSMKEHIENIVHFSKNICELPVLENLIILGEMLHDVGKLGIYSFQTFSATLLSFPSGLFGASLSISLASVPSNLAS